MLPTAKMHGRVSSIALQKQLFSLTTQLATLQKQIDHRWITLVARNMVVMRDLLLILDSNCTTPPEKQLASSYYNHNQQKICEGNHLLAPRMWKFLTTTFKCICNDSFVIILSVVMQCIVVVRWTGKLPVGLPYAISLSYQIKSVIHKHCLFSVYETKVTTLAFAEATMHQNTGIGAVASHKTNRSKMSVKKQESQQNAKQWKQHTYFSETNHAQIGRNTQPSIKIPLLKVLQVKVSRCGRALCILLRQNT